MWHVVPGMKSHVALNSGTLPFCMHLSPLFVFHEQPDFRVAGSCLIQMKILRFKKVIRRPVPLQRETAVSIHWIGKKTL
jgi:hypothetical protein